MSGRRLKIGIDVGGTFTHAVAIDPERLAIAGKACVPTTHRALEGVAKGVTQSLEKLLEVASIDPEDVALVAHSTTQATNALLEGDVAVVGIVCLGSGLEGRIAWRQADLGDVEICPGKSLKTRFVCLDTGPGLDEEAVRQALEGLVDRGAGVIVATEPFGVDRPGREERVVEIAGRMGLLATAASSISKLYGLRVRTRTAALNASMMPTMLATADRTEAAVRACRITAPLMVMRSDGGIMDVGEMRRRPILTMLSGPAAGVAAALRYVRVTDGVFLEVGGTSTDISVIRNGKPQVRTAHIAGRPLHLRTLDVRTLGVAGGSLPRVAAGRVVDVGPRSAHIADLEYAAFTGRPAGELEPWTGRPLESDPSDYVALAPRGQDRPAVAVTPTCASRLESEGAASPAAGALELLGRSLGRPAGEVAREILTVAAEKIRPTIDRLVRDYRLDRELVELVGGGGGAPAIVPFTARHLGFSHALAENTEVISAIGAALGMIRETVERTNPAPTDADLLAIRREALEAVLRMGADPSTIEVTVEIDPKGKRIAAVAMGSSELETARDDRSILDEARRVEIAAASLRCAPAEVVVAARTPFALVAVHTQVRSRLFGLVQSRATRARVVDGRGTIRLKLSDATVEVVRPATARARALESVERHTAFGDGGATLPDLFMLTSGRIADFTGLVRASQVAALVEAELAKAPADEDVVLLVAPRR